MKKLSLILLSFLLTLSLLLVGCDKGNLPGYDEPDDEPSLQERDETSEALGSESAEESHSDPNHTLSEIPPYSGTPYVAIQQNVPSFTDAELVTESYETYSPLDALGRCGIAMACIGTDLMPTEDRGSIGNVTPSGWVNNRYDSEVVSGGYIYNRSHLIGFQLTGENDNEKNLITGTRYFNVEGMLPFENMVADYLKEEPEHHVMYRITPIYEGNNLVVDGIQMEAYSVEDQGEGVSFNVYIYNVQPGIHIDYATGNNWLDTENPPVMTDTERGPVLTDTNGEIVRYILNTKTQKFHDPDCGSADDIQEENRETYSGDRADLIERGYSPCGNCDP